MNPQSRPDVDKAIVNFKQSCNEKKAFKESKDVQLKID